MPLLLAAVSWRVVSARQVIIWCMSIPWRRATHIPRFRTAVIIWKTGARKRYNTRLFSHRYTKLTCRTFVLTYSFQFCLALTSRKQYKVQEVQPTGTELILSRSLG